MKKLLKISCIRTCTITVAAILLVNGCRKSNPDRQAELDRIPVRLVPVTRQKMSKPVSASGYVSAAEESKLSFKIGGLIDSIYAGEGDRVNKGTLLASLKPDEIAAMASQAKSAFEKAKRDLERAENLYSDSVATLEQVQNAKTGMEVAKAQLEIARFNLAHASIVAPEDGKILKRLAERNELIAPGYPVFLFGAGRKDWVIKIGVPDLDVVRCKTGDPAEIAFDAYPGETFQGAVREIAGAPDPMSGLFEISLRIDSGRKPLMTGFVGRVSISPSDRNEVAMIPLVSLVRGHEHQGYVFTVKDNEAVRLPVELLFLTNNRAVVSRGLSGIENVVAEGASYLRPGSVVEVIQDSTITGQDAP